MLEEIRRSTASLSAVSLSASPLTLLVLIHPEGWMELLVESSGYYCLEEAAERKTAVICSVLVV